MLLSKRFVVALIGAVGDRRDKRTSQGLIEKNFVDPVDPQIHTQN